MKTFVFFVLAIIFSSSIYGNDGVYLSRGSLIYPTQETNISMNKEILSFTINNKIAYVDIQFQFNNPENKNRKLLIGFQAPTPSGDVSDSLSNSKQIKNFTIMQEGNILPYSLKAAECETCELKDPSDLFFTQSEIGVFVYLFEITFKPGLNQINHSYNFRASSNVAIDQFYNYILTTGSKWAGGQIKDLTVNIDMGENQFFYVRDIFGDSAEWSVIGTGKVTPDNFDFMDDYRYPMIRTLHGSLQIKVRDFEPISNIEFGIINDFTFISYPIYHEKYEKGEIVAVYNLDLSKIYTKRELRLMRNTMYAQQGLSFNSPDLRTYFSQFSWYIPDPNLKMENIVLSDKEKAFVKDVLKKEQELK